MGQPPPLGVQHADRRAAHAVHGVPEWLDVARRVHERHGVLRSSCCVDNSVVYRNRQHINVTDNEREC